MKKIIIALDGHSSCGKSTMAKALAKKIGYIYVDTGAMYRTVTLFALRNNIFNGAELDAARLEALLPEVSVSFVLDPETNLPLACLNGEVVEREIRTMEVSSRVSPIAALPFVRTMLTKMQQQMGEAKGIVMDGRDIGTAVPPPAPPHPPPPAPASPRSCAPETSRRRPRFRQQQHDARGAKRVADAGLLESGRSDLRVDQ